MIIDHFNDLPPLKDSPSTCPLDSTAITVVLHIHLEKPLLKTFCHLPFLTLNTTCLKSTQQSTGLRVCLQGQSSDSNSSDRDIKQAN